MKTPLFIRSCNISTLPLGINLISYQYLIANNLNGKEFQKIKSKLNFVNQETTNKKQSSAKTLFAPEKLIDKLAQKHKIWIMPYRSTYSLWNLCTQKKWNKAFIHPSLFQKLEDKSNLKNLFKNTDFLIPSENLTKSKYIWEEISKKWSTKFIIQIIKHNKKPISGGKGTFFVNNKKDFEKALTNTTPKDTIKITKLIEGDSLSINGCIYNNEILLTNFWCQIIGPKECSTHESAYNGGDFSSSKKYSPSTKQKIIEISNKIGKKLISLGYQGIFNLDFILENSSKKIYLIEINARLSGSTGILDYFHHINGIPPLLDYHVKSFLKENVQKKTLAAHKKLFLTKINGSQIIMRSLESKTVKIIRSPHSGIYQWNQKNNCLKFLRNGWNPNQLKKDEILIYGIAPEKYILEPHERVANIVSLKRALGKDSYHLNKISKKIVRYLYKQFKFSTYKT